jgi:hypothetical protein
MAQFASAHRFPRFQGLAGFAVAAAIMLAVGMSLQTRASAGAQESVRLVEGTTVAISTPAFIQVGKRYAITWAGGGPPQTYTIKTVRKDGWVEVQVAEDNVDPAFLVPGQVPSRWLHVGIATSVQEMRPLPFGGN